MDKGKKQENEFVKEEYVRQICGMLNKINDAGTLEYLHTFIKKFVEKWG